MRVRHHLLHHVERDRLDRRAAVAAVGALAVDVGVGLECVEVDAGDGVDGVDRGKRIGSAALGRARGHADVGDIRRELDDDRGARLFLHPARDLLAVLRHLPYGRSHAALAHAVRATEVKLQAVGSGVFRALQQCRARSRACSRP